MTLITSFDVHGCPILLGDLLISSDENAKQTMSVPTINEITKIFPKGSGFVPTALRQKVALINGTNPVKFTDETTGGMMLGISSNFVESIFKNLPSAKKA